MIQSRTITTRSSEAANAGKSYAGTKAKPAHIAPRLFAASLLRGAIVVLFLTLPLLGAASEGSPARSEGFAPGTPGYAADWLRASAHPTLAETLTPAQGAWLVNGLAVVVLLLGIAVSVKHLIGDKGRRTTSLDGQPIGVTEHKPCIDRDSHEQQMKEVWAVINGLRRAVESISTSVAGIAAAREANGDRLGEISRDLHKLTQEVGQLTGQLGEISRRLTSK